MTTAKTIAADAVQDSFTGVKRSIIEWHIENCVMRRKP